MKAEIAEAIPILQSISKTPYKTVFNPILTTIMQLRMAQQNRRIMIKDMVFILMAVTAEPLISIFKIVG